MRWIVLLLLALAAPVWADLTPINQKGQTVDIDSRLVPGKENIVVFHAKSVYLSHQFYQELTRLAGRNKELPILIIDAPDARSPVAKQYQVRTFPYVRIYDNKGKIRLEGAPAYNAVLKMNP